MSQPGDTVTTYGYDADGQLTSEEIAYGGGTQAQYSYTYDADGNRLSETTPQGTQQYAYDALGRLTSVTNPGGSTQGYTYDADGNRVSLSAGGQTTTYAYNADSELTSATDGSGTSTYSYDQDGNQTGVSGPAGTSTYQYNGLDQMTEADLPGGTVVDQGYDGLGHLAWSDTSENGTVTAAVYYLYDGSYVIGTFGSDGDLQSFYLRDPGGSSALHVAAGDERSGCVLLQHRRSRQRRGPERSERSGGRDLRIRRVWQPDLKHGPRRDRESADMAAPALRRGVLQRGSRCLPARSAALRPHRWSVNNGGHLPRDAWGPQQRERVCLRRGRPDPLGGSDGDALLCRKHRTAGEIWEHQLLPGQRKSARA